MTRRRWITLAVAAAIVAGGWTYLGAGDLDGRWVTPTGHIRLVVVDHRGELSGHFVTGDRAADLTGHRVGDAVVMRLGSFGLDGYRTGRDQMVLRFGSRDLLFTRYRRWSDRIIDRATGAASFDSAWDATP